MEVLAVAVDREFTTSEVVRMIRSRVGFGSRRSLYEWMPCLAIKPNRYYSQRDAAKFLCFAYVLRKKRSRLIAQRTTVYLLETMTEEEFIKTVFEYR